MSEKIYSSMAGAGSSTLGILSGIVSVNSLAEAFILGFVGAVGGLIAHLAWKYIKTKLYKHEKRSE